MVDTYTVLALVVSVVAAVSAAGLMYYTRKAFKRSIPGSFDYRMSALEAKSKETEHKLNKLEVSVAVIQTDTGWIKNTLVEVNEKLDKLMDR